MKMPEDPTELEVFRGEGMQAKVTRRDPASIAKLHNLNTTALRELISSKDRILDIGPGDSSLYKFASMGCVMINLDLLHRSKIKSTNPFPWVVSSGDILPFPDDTFDLIISTYSLPFWRSSINQAKRYFSETYRCLAPAGIALTTPVEESVIEHITPELASLPAGSALGDLRLEAMHIETDFALKIKKGDLFTEQEIDLLDISPLAGYFD